jgi:hypothetical protein
MRQVETFKVRITMSQGSQWVRTFVGGRPTPDDILSAIDAPDSSYATLVRDYLLPEDNMRHCFYADTNVGRIEVDQQTKAFVVRAAEWRRGPMKKVESYKVRITTSQGSQWEGTFVGGRPIPDDILSAIGVQDSSYATLIRDHLLPDDDDTQQCVYAGTKVGRIGIEKQPKAFVVRAAE